MCHDTSQVLSVLFVLKQLKPDTLFIIGMLMSIVTRYICMYIVLQGQPIQKVYYCEGCPALLRPEIGT